MDIFKSAEYAAKRTVPVRGTSSANFWIDAKKTPPPLDTLLLLIYVSDNGHFTTMGKLTEKKDYKDHYRFAGAMGHSSKDIRKDRVKAYCPTQIPDFL